MATETITNITCDLTGKKLDQDKKAPTVDNITLINGTRSVDVEITIPEGVDVDRDSLLRAIGNVATRVTRAPRGTGAGTPTPSTDPIPRNGRKSNAPAAEESGKPVAA